MRPFVDVLYREIFGAETEIERLNRDNPEEEPARTLDEEYAIDLHIRLVPTLLVLTGQEKCLSRCWADQRTLTVEKMNDPRRGIRGDWFNLAAQFYFCGYINDHGNGFDPWVLVDWPAIVLATHLDLIEWHTKPNTDGAARADFRYCYIRDIPNRCIIADGQRGSHFEQWLHR